MPNLEIGSVSDIHPEHVETLKSELEKRRTRNRAYSLRAFAKHIGLDAGSLSRILNRKQDLSLRSAIVIAHKLAFTPEESRIFLASVADQKIREISATLSESAAKKTAAPAFEAIL